MQAHVVSLLGKAGSTKILGPSPSLRFSAQEKGEPGKREPDSHIFADEPEAELDAPEGEEMWNMVRPSVFKKGCHAAW